MGNTTFITIVRTADDGTKSFGTCPESALPIWKKKGFEESTPEARKEHEDQSAEQAEQVDVPPTLSDPADESVPPSELETLGQATATEPVEAPATDGPAPVSDEPQDSAGLTGEDSTAGESAESPKKPGRAGRFGG